MRALRSGAIATLLSCLACPGLAQDTVAWTSIGDWPVVIDPLLGNGCLTYQAYDTGTFLRIGFNRQANEGVIIIENKAWSSLRIGSEHPLSLVFGAAQPIHTTGTILNVDGAFALWVSFIDADVIIDFMQEDYVQVWLDDRMLDQLSLTGSFDALSEVMRCQWAMDAK